MNSHTSVEQSIGETKRSQGETGICRLCPEEVQQITTVAFPYLCAHRGLSQACPENTLPAFAAAIAVGAHEIEFDVWSSRNGVPVICHDASVDRTTNGTGKVSELSWNEIRSLDAGIRTSEVWRGIRMPRFEEVLDITHGHVGLNIHIKSEGPEGTLIKQVCDLLTERGLINCVYLALDTESALQTAFAYAPEIARACLVSQNDPNLLIDLAERYACQRIQFGRQVTEAQIHRAHDLGIICNLFWSDDPEDAMAYVQNGIDVILTNCAHIMIAGGFKVFSMD